MSRMDISTLIGHSRNVIRDLDEPVVLAQMINISANELSHELYGTAAFQTVASMSVSSGATSATIDLSATTSKHVAVQPVSLTFSASGIRYTPEWRDYIDFETNLFYERERGGLIGIPLYWSTNSVIDEEGKCEVEFYPALDANYTMHFLVNFFPHNTSATSDYVPFCNAIEHLLIIGCAYYSARITKEDLSLQFLREYEDAVETFKASQGKMGGAPEGRLDPFRRKGRPYMRQTGVEPAVAWDTNPAIPYDPANPNEGQS